MTVGELKKQLSEWGTDDDAVVVTRGNAHPSFKITHVEDSTCVGVVEIRITDFPPSDDKYFNWWQD